MIVVCMKPTGAIAVYVDTCSFPMLFNSIVGKEGKDEQKCPSQKACGA